MTKKLKWQWRHRRYDGLYPDAGWVDFHGTPDVWWAQMEYRQVPA